jgi:hypothetical protein
MLFTSGTAKIMGLKPCYWVMDIPLNAQPQRALSEAIPALFERWLADFFAPRVIYLTLEDVATHSLAQNSSVAWEGTPPLWQGETLREDQPLTHCDPAGSQSLLSELREMLAAHPPTKLHLYAEGALYHQAQGELTPHWYGRWYTFPPPMLTELVVIRLEWNNERRNLELSFPHSGYPLTSAALLTSAQLGSGDPAMAAANRARIMPALAVTPFCFGLDRAAVRWSNDGDYSGLYPEDAAALRQQWLPKLQSGELVYLDTDGQKDAAAISDSAPSAILSALATPGLRRLWAMEELRNEPSGDPRVASALETALADRTPCRLDQYYLGETRLLAGLALVAERAARGDKAPLHLHSLPPVPVGDLIMLIEHAGLTWPSPTNDDDDPALRAWRLAQEHGLLVEQTLELRDSVDVAQLATAWRADLVLDDTASQAAPPTAIPNAASAIATTQPVSEDDVRFYVDVLTQGSRDERVFALRNLARQPTGDPRVRAALQPLLADTTPCVLQIPYRFGELCLLAGAALAAERWAAGDDRPLSLRCVAPVTPDELDAMRMASRITAPPYCGDPTEQQLALFARLRSHNQLAQLDLELRYPVHIGWLGV